MQSAAKHLACGSDSIDWITQAREMLRCALHDILNKMVRGLYKQLLYQKRINHGGAQLFLTLYRVNRAGPASGQQVLLAHLLSNFSIMPLNRTYLAVLALLNTALLCGRVQAQSAAPLAVSQADAPTKAPGKSIRIACGSSIPASSRPLFVVDGQPLSEQDALSINPADIDKIDVLQSTAATALYGSRAANGVVLMTLKHRVGKYLHQPEAKKDHLD